MTIWTLHKQLSISHFAEFWLGMHRFIITPVQKNCWLLVTPGQQTKQKKKSTQYTNSNTGEVPCKPVPLNLNTVHFSMSSFYTLNVYPCHRTDVFSVFYEVFFLISTFRKISIVKITKYYVLSL